MSRTTHVLLAVLVLAAILFTVEIQVLRKYRDSVVSSANTVVFNRSAEHWEAGQRQPAEPVGEPDFEKFNQTVETKLSNVEDFEALDRPLTQLGDNFTSWLVARYFKTSRAWEFSAFLREMREKDAGFHVKRVSSLLTAGVDDVSLILINPDQKQLRDILFFWGGPVVVVLTADFKAGGSYFEEIESGGAESPVKILWVSTHSDEEDVARRVGILAADSQFVMYLHDNSLTPTSMSTYDRLKKALAKKVLWNLDKENYFIAPVCYNMKCEEASSTPEGFFDVQSVSFSMEALLIFNKVTSQVSFLEHKFVASRQFPIFPARTLFLPQGAFLRITDKSAAKVETWLTIESAPQQTAVRRILDLRWEQWVENYEKNLNEAQYCMLWCQADDQIFKNGSAAASVYRDSPRTHHYAIEYQAGGENATGLRCCQIATRESFSVIYDSTKPELVEDAITMVTFGTINRIEALREQRARWKGPLLFVLYSIDYNDHLMKTDYRKDAEQLVKVATDEGWEDTMVVQYVALYEKDKIALREFQNYMNVTMQKDGELIESIIPDFPINSLRNVAMDFSKTRFVMANDVDFITGDDTYGVLKSHLELLRAEDKVALSIPPFEKRSCYRSVSPESRYPQNWTDLNQRFKDGAVRPWSCELGRWNSSTLIVEPSEFAGTCGIELDTNFTLCKAVRLHHYQEYFDNSRDGSLTLVFQPEVSNTDEQNLYYEPYLVQSRVTVDGPLIRYNELFISRGFNKVAFVSSMRKLHYRFYTVPGTFLIHKDHPGTVWRSGKAYGRLKDRTRLMIDTFLRDIEAGRKW